MKNILPILLLGLLTFSFLGDAGLFSFQEKAKMELGNDLDSEKEIEKSEKDKFTALSSFSNNDLLIAVCKPNTPMTTRLFQISYEVEIHPPRA